MAVVINDFEVLAEGAPPAAEPEADRPAPPRAAAPTPQEIELVSRRQRERAERVRAD